MLGHLKPEEVEELLASQLIGRIGCHADNTTYVVPISYAYDGEYIYCRADEGMKLTLMRKNPEVCFEVDRFDDLANWKSVIAWGTYEELSEEDPRKKALQHLVNRVLPLVSSQLMHLSPQWPFPEQDLNNIPGVVFRLRLREKTGRFENNTQTRGPRTA